MAGKGPLGVRTGTGILPGALSARVLRRGVSEAPGERSGAAKTPLCAALPPYLQQPLALPAPTAKKIANRRLVR